MEEGNELRKRERANDRNFLTTKCFFLLWAFWLIFFEPVGNLLLIQGKLLRTSNFRVNISKKHFFVLPPPTLAVRAVVRSLGKAAPLGVLGLRVGAFTFYIDHILSFLVVLNSREEVARLAEAVDVVSGFDGTQSRQQAQQHDCREPEIGASCVIRVISKLTCARAFIELGVCVCCACRDGPWGNQKVSAITYSMSGSPLWDWLSAEPFCNIAFKPLTTKLPPSHR